jgi:hypothetical protein
MSRSSLQGGCSLACRRHGGFRVTEVLVAEQQMQRSFVRVECQEVRTISVKSA